MIKGLIVGVILLVMIVTGIEGAESTPGDTPYYGVDIGSYSNTSRRVRNRRSYTNFISAINSLASTNVLAENGLHLNFFIAMSNHGLELSIVPDTLSREGVRIKIATDNDSVYTVTLDMFFNLYAGDGDYNWLRVSPICGSYATKVGGRDNRWFDGIFAPVPEACLDRDAFGRNEVMLYDGSFHPTYFQGEDFFLQGEYIIRHIFFECFGHLPDGQYKISIPVNMDFRGFQRFQISTTASVEFSLP